MARALMEKDVLKAQTQGREEIDQINKCFEQMAVCFIGGGKF